MSALPFATTFLNPEGLACGESADKLQVIELPKHASTELRNDYSITTRRYQLDDGSRYDAQIFHPNAPRYDIGATYTTPWCTDLKGFNSMVGNALAEAGIVSVAVSPERLTGKQLFQRFGKLALLHDVHAQHAILDHIDTEDRFKRGVTINTGYSRGAMVGFGFNAYSDKYDRDVVYSDYIDPCLEHAVRLRDVSWQRVPTYVGRELVAFGKGLHSYKARDILGMTLSAAQPSACFWLQQVAVGKTLFSGETGNFVASLHPDTTAHITLYVKSRFNHAPDYARQLSRYPNISSSIENGYHLTGVGSNVRADMLGRVILAQNLLRDNATPAELANAIRSTLPATP